MPRACRPCHSLAPIQALPRCLVVAYELLRARMQHRDKLVVPCCIRICVLIKGASSPGKTSREHGTSNTWENSVECSSRTLFLASYNVVSIDREAPAGEGGGPACLVPVSIYHPPCPHSLVPEATGLRHGCCIAVRHQDCKNLVVLH